MPDPAEFADADGEVSCAKCGYPPAVRLRAASDRACEPGIGPTGALKESSMADSKPSFKFIGFNAPPDLASALADQAVSQERSVSAEIRFALRKHLSAKGSDPMSDPL